LAGYVRQVLAFGSIRLELVARGRGLERVKTAAGDSLIALEKAVEAFQTALHFVEPLLAVIDRPAVMSGQQEKAQRLGRAALEQLGYDDLVALALGHLAGADFHEAVVHPVAREWYCRIRLRLRQLVFVMGKLQIEPAAVNVD